MKRTNIKIGVSSCLLGNNVRYDGSHKKMIYITDILSKQFILVPICPEFELGMGIPREAVMLVGKTYEPKMVGINSGENWTDKMLSYSNQRVLCDDIKELSGCILKKNSPSCGIKGVKIYTTLNQFVEKGIGLFAKELLNTHPSLPVIEEDELNDPNKKENFINKVLSYAQTKND